MSENIRAGTGSGLQHRHHEVGVDLVSRLSRAVALAVVLGLASSCGESSETVAASASPVQVIVGRDATGVVNQIGIPEASVVSVSFEADRRDPGRFGGSMHWKSANVTTEISGTMSEDGSAMEFEEVRYIEGGYSSGILTGAKYKLLRDEQGYSGSWIFTGRDAPYACQGTVEFDIDLGVPATETLLPRQHEEDLTWYEVIRQDPDPKVVHDVDVRTYLRGLGLPWLVRDRRTGIELVLIPDGTYMRGRSEGDEFGAVDPGVVPGDKELPAHEVVIPFPFYLGRTEVTIERWSHFIAESGYQAKEDPVTPYPKYVSEMDKNREKNQQYPAFWIWDRDAQAFCSFYGLGLPSAAQWEYACRADTTGRFWWGNDPADGEGRCNVEYSDPEWSGDDKFHFDDGYEYMSPVASFESNPFGLYDMIGNVQEITSTIYDREFYSKCADIGRVDDAFDETAKDEFYYFGLESRGGHFYSNPVSARCSSRGSSPSDWGSPLTNTRGFRVFRYP